MNGRSSHLVVALAAALLFATTGRAADVKAGGAVEEKREKTKLAVLDLTGSANVDKELLSSLGTTVTNELNALGPFEAISNADVRRMLEFEAEKQKLGCDGTDASCLAEIGGALGAAYLVAGQVLKVEDTWLVQLQLFSIEAAKPVGRAAREYRGELKGLFDEVRIASRIAVRDLLAEASGHLTVNASEEGATVRIDGSIVGTTPLASMLVPGGVHNVSVEKEGFILFRKDVEVTAHGNTDVDAVLVPSAEYRRRYESREGLTRVLAWSTAGAGVLFLAGAGGLFGLGEVVAGELRSDVDAYNLKAIRTDDELRSLDRREQDLALIDAGTYAALSAGLLSAGAAIVLFIVGDDPGRYADVGDDVE